MLARFTRTAAVAALLAPAAPAAITAQQAAPVPGRLVISPARPSVMVGDSVRITAQLVDAQGKVVEGAKILFADASSSETGGINREGMFSGVAMGPSPIVVTGVVTGQKPVIQRVTVQVLPGAAARIELEPRPARLLAGQVARISRRVLAANGDQRTDVPTWRSSAPNVVKVVGDGVLEAVSPGKATVTATSGAATATLDLEVPRATLASVTVSPGTAQARTGDVVRFAAAAKDAAGAVIGGLTPSWSFAPGQGQVDPDGGFVAYEPGTYTVTAQLGSRVGTATVTVAARDVRRKATVVGTMVRTKFPTSEVWVHPNGKVAYLGTHLGGDRFYTIDISNPSSPVIVDSVQSNTRLVNDLMTSADGKVLVFTREGAADRKNGIVICTLDDPLHPKIVSEFTEGVTGGVHSTFIYTQPRYGTHIYLTNDATGAVHVIDINDPAHPKEVAQWKTPRADLGRYVHDIDVQDGLLYGSWWNDGLVILDIGNGIKGGSPSNPQFVSQYKYDLNSLYKQVEQTYSPGFIRGTHTAWRHKNYVFIADEVFSQESGQDLFQGKVSRAYGRLQVLDVTDIYKPKSVAWYEPEFGGVHNVWIAGDTLYMGAYNAGFRTFDIGGELRGDLRAQGREMAFVNPVDGKGFLPNAAMTWGVVVKNGLAFVNDFNNGLFIVKMEPKPGIVP